jgi:hypothetical protein
MHHRDEEADHPRLWLAVVNGDEGKIGREPLILDQRPPPVRAHGLASPVVAQRIVSSYTGPFAEPTVPHLDARGVTAKARVGLYSLKVALHRPQHASGAQAMSFEKPTGGRRAVVRVRHHPPWESSHAAELAARALNLPFQ